MSSVGNKSQNLTVVTLTSLVAGVLFGFALRAYYIEVATCHGESLAQYQITDGCVGPVDAVGTLIVVVSILTVGILGVCGHLLIKKFWRKK